MAWISENVAIGAWRTDPLFHHPAHHLPSSLLMLGAGPAQAATALTLLVCCKTVAGADAALCGTEAGVLLLAALITSDEVGKLSPPSRGQQEHGPLQLLCSSQCACIAGCGA